MPWDSWQCRAGRTAGRGVAGVAGVVVQRQGLRGRQDRGPLQGAMCSVADGAVFSGENG